MEHKIILDNRYIIYENGAIYACDTWKKITQKTNNRGQYTVKLYNKYDERHTYVVPRLVYFSFHPELDWHNKHIQVKIKDNKEIYKLEDLIPYEIV